MKDNHSQLLIDIQRKSNINISKVRDVKFLKEEIESTIDSKIGYNTLRRLFGFLDGHSPSEKTLNRLSNYLGYNSFSNYLNNKSNYNDWYFQQYLLQLREKKKIDIAEISNINTGIKNENNLVYLGYFIGFHIERGNIQILISLFSQLDFRSISATQFMKFAIIITMSLSILSDRKSLSIYRTLIEFDNFRNQVPLLFIDYSNLYLRYNQVLQYIAANKANSSDSLFTKLMFAYKDYYIDQIDLSPTNYINKPIDFDDFYVTLKGRYYGVCLLFELDTFNKLKIQIRSECKKNKISYFLIEIIPALIVKDYYDFLNEILEKYYEDVFDGDVWSSETTNAIYLIGVATNNWYKNNIPGAYKNLELVKLKNVEIAYVEYVSLFYQLTLLKISFSENNQVLNKTAYNALRKLIAKTHFQRFETLAKPYLI